MATIYCFTSTGNSLYAAKTLAEKINGNVVPMNRGAIHCEDDVIGFVFPDYFWGLPRIVERFVAKIQITNKDAYVFAVLTCGGQGFGELGRLKKLLDAKGIRLWYGMRLISVSNYIPEYEPNDSDALRRGIDDQIMRIADAVNNRESNRIQMFSIINKIAYAFYPDESCDKYFTVAPTCTGCTTCLKVCPVNNIVMKDGKPDFQHRCEHCLACLHHCPVQAIDWKGKTKGKERFRNAGISLDELIAFHNHDGGSI